MKKLLLILFCLFFTYLNLFASDFIEVTQKKDFKIYDVFIDIDIQKPTYYRNLIYMLRYADEKDIFIFHLNTDGGDLFASLELYNEIINTKAETIANIYKAYSGGACLVMACKKIIVNKFAVMMIHPFIVGVTYGSVVESKEYIDFLRKMNDGVIFEMFNDFLSLKEIELIKSNKILWLNEKEIIIKSKKINKLLK